MVTALPLLFVLKFLLVFIVFMVYIHFIFYSCLELRFPDVETNPSPRCPVLGGCRIFCCDVQGLSKNLGNLTVASSQYDLLLCSVTLVSDRHCISELLVRGFCHPVFVGMGCLRPIGRLHMCEMDMGHFANLNLSMVVTRCWYLG